MTTFKQYFEEAKANPHKTSYAQLMTKRHNRGDWSKAMRQKVIAMEGDNTRSFFNSLSIDRQAK